MEIWIRKSVKKICEKRKFVKKKNRRKNSEKTCDKISEKWSYIQKILGLYGLKHHIVEISRERPIKGLGYSASGSLENWVSQFYLKFKRLSFQIRNIVAPFIFNLLFLVIFYFYFGKLSFTILFKIQKTFISDTEYRLLLKFYLKIKILNFI